MPSLYVILSLLYLTAALPQDQNGFNQKGSIVSHEDVPAIPLSDQNLIISSEFDILERLASRQEPTPEAAPEAAPEASQTVQSPAEPNLDSTATTEQAEEAVPPGSATTGIPAGSCKWVPSQSGWPTDAEWNALGQAVKGRLLRPVPPAAACHGIGDGSCDSVKLGFRDSTWHANNPVSNMWQNYNNYSCMPTGTSCTGTGYPVYVVEAQEASDVKAAIDFAREKNVRLNVKSTGHDFLGR
jgi:hypothetical protein